MNIRGAGQMTNFLIVHEQHSVYTSVILRVVGDLRILPPHHLPPTGDQAQLAYVHLDNCSLSDHAQVGVHGTGRILLHPNNWKAECGSQLWMGHMSLLHPKPHGSDKPLKLWWFPGEIVPNKSHLSHHPLPTLPSALSRFQYFKHFSLRLSPDSRNGHLPLSCFFLPLLLYHVGDDFGLGLLLPVHQVGWDSTSICRSLCRLFCLLLLMCLDSLLHLHLLIEPLLVVQLGLDISQ